MSEDVSRFLSQVKELGERRIEEDEARSRELEEKILQDRKERQARRRGKRLFFYRPSLCSLCFVVSFYALRLSQRSSVEQLAFTISATSESAWCCVSYAPSDPAYFGRESLSGPPRTCIVVVIRAQLLL